MSCNIKVKLPDGKSLVIDQLNESDPLRTIHLIIAEKIGRSVCYFKRFLTSEFTNLGIFSRCPSAKASLF